MFVCYNSKTLYQVVERDRKVHSQVCRCHHQTQWMSDPKRWGEISCRSHHYQSSQHFLLWQSSLHLTSSNTHTGAHISSQQQYICKHILSFHKNELWYLDLLLKAHLDQVHLACTNIIKQEPIKRSVMSISISGAHWRTRAKLTLECAMLTHTAKHSHLDPRSSLTSHFLS